MRGFRLVEMTMKRKQRGFTLLEIMLVVTIIALLLGTAIYKLAGNVEYARHTRVQADIQGIGTQLKLYESMNGFYPTTDQGLQALVSQPDSDPRPTRWYQLYKDMPKDPWQNEYIYLIPVRKTQASTTCIPQGPIGKQSQQTT